MAYLICYDITEDKIRSRLAKYLESFAWRLQGSVFLCEALPMPEEKIWKVMGDMTKKSSCRRLLIAPLAGGKKDSLWICGKWKEEEVSYVAV